MAAYPTGAPTPSRGGHLDLHESAPGPAAGRAHPGDPSRRGGRRRAHAARGRRAPRRVSGREARLARGAGFGERARRPALARRGDPIPARAAEARAATRAPARARTRSRRHPSPAARGTLRSGRRLPRHPEERRAREALERTAPRELRAARRARGRRLVRHGARPPASREAEPLRAQRGAGPLPRDRSAASRAPARRARGRGGTDRARARAGARARRHPSRHERRHAAQALDARRLWRGGARAGRGGHPRPRQRGTRRERSRDRGGRARGRRRRRAGRPDHARPPRPRRALRTLASLPGRRQRPDARGLAGGHAGGAAARPDRPRGERTLPGDAVADGARTDRLQPLSAWLRRRPLHAYDRGGDRPARDPRASGERRRAIGRLRRPAQRFGRGAPRMSAREILVRGPNWTGDLIMATPGFRALRAGFPEARITLHVRAGLRPLLDGAPWFDAVLAVESYRRAPAAMLREARALRRRARFDLGLCLPDSFESALLMRAAGVRHVVGYARGGRRALLHQAVPPPRAEGRRLLLARELHVLRLVEALGCERRGTELELFVTEA